MTSKFRSATTGKVAFVSSHIEKASPGDAHTTFIPRLLEKFLDEFHLYPKVNRIADLPLSPKQKTFCRKQTELLFATSGNTVHTRRISAMMYFGCYRGWVDVVDEPRIGERVFVVKDDDSAAHCFKIRPDGSFLIALAVGPPGEAT